MGGFGGLLSTFSMITERFAGITLPGIVIIFLGIRGGTGGGRSRIMMGSGVGGVVMRCRITIGGSGVAIRSGSCLIIMSPDIF